LMIPHESTLSLDVQSTQDYGIALQWTRDMTPHAPKIFVAKHRLPMCEKGSSVPPPEQPQRNIPGEMGAVFSKLFAALIGNREVRGSCCTLLAAYEALSQALSRAITLRRFVCSSLA
jgi:hypothetical protein